MNRFALTAVIVFMLIMAVSVLGFTFQKCGWKTFLLGNGATAAAMTGMCDEK